jgi:hypothetical protein
MNSDDLKELTKSSPASKFEPVCDIVEKMSLEDFIKHNERFWNQQSVELHRCYKKGIAYANNNNKKTSIELLKDMSILLKNIYKTPGNSNQLDDIFNIITTSLKMIDDIEYDVDKYCILSIIQGYTLGCLSKYEK